MSAKIMGQVWDLDISHASMLVLLAMADHADHEGRNIYPSVGLIAWKVGYSQRQVQRIIKALVAEGILIEESRQIGKTTRYRINTSAAPQKQPYTPERRQNVTPTHDKMSPHECATHDTAMSPPPMTQLCHPTHDTAMSPEPSVNHHVEPSVGDAVASCNSDELPAAATLQSESESHDQTDSFTPTVVTGSNGAILPNADHSISKQQSLPISCPEPLSPNSAPPPSPNRAGKMLTAAAQVYRDMACLTPSKAQRHLLDEIDDLDLWRETVSYWIGRGWNPRNISGMLERYTSAFQEKQQSRSRRETLIRETRERIEQFRAPTPEERQEMFRRMNEYRKTARWLQPKSGD